MRILSNHVPARLIFGLVAAFISQASITHASNAAVPYSPKLAAQALVADHSNKCLDVANGSSDSNAQVIQYGCHLDVNQQWTTRSITGGLEWRNVATSKCLTVRSKQAGAAVMQDTCTGRVEQSFARVGKTLRSAYSGLCVDITGGSTNDLAAVIQWSCHGASNQSFSTRDVGGSPNPDKQIVFRNLMSIHRTAIANGQTWSFTEPKIQLTINAFTKALPALVNEITNGRVKFENYAVVTNDPITKWGTGQYAALPDIDGTGNWRSRVGPTGNFDVHFVMSPRPQPALWALGGGFCCDNANRVGWVFVDRPTTDVASEGLLAGWIHEFLHVIGDAFYKDRLGVSQMPLLHDAEAFGYSRNTAGREEWVQWYKDYMNRQVQRDGKLWGIGEEGWNRGNARDYLRAGRP